MGEVLMPSSSLVTPVGPIISCLRDYISVKAKHSFSAEKPESGFKTIIQCQCGQTIGARQVMATRIAIPWTGIRMAYCLLSGTSTLPFQFQMWSMFALQWLEMKLLSISMV